MGTTSHSGYILIGRESVYGTAVSATKDIGLVQSFTQSNSRNLLRNYGFSSADAQEIVAGNLNLGLSVEVLFQHGRLIEYMTGAAVTHDATSTPDIKHTYALADTLPSLTLEYGHDLSTDIVQKFEGAWCLGGTITHKLNDAMRLKLDLIAEDVNDSASASSAVVSTLATYPFRMVTFQTGAQASEATVREVSNFEFSVNNAGGGDPAIYEAGSIKMAASPEVLQRQVSGKFTAGFRSAAEMERFLGGAAVTNDPTIPSAIFNITNGVAAASGLRQLYINLLNTRYATHGQSSQIGSYVMQDFELWSPGINSIYSYDTITSGNWG